ncbi:MAG: hypothetical protein K8L99_21210 [Anaerolineae bacterium]|nr:hypothetical protein [Anaerolineae bacterium]
MSDDSFYKVSYLQGMQAFQTARTKAFWYDVINLLRGKPAELLSFDDIKTRLRLREESYRGLQNVPVDRIIGSVGRYRDFTTNFLPKNPQMQERWSRVYAHTSGLQGLPPVELYKVDDVYFVRDGNHRVSVARQLGHKTIEAHVTELPTSIDLEPGMSVDELDAASAYAAFLDETNLRQTRPHHQSIKLSEPSRYTDLLGHVYMHRRALELEGDCPCTIEQAAVDWYDNVYRPAVTLIRKYDILQYVPGRTEGDLYLWLVEHLSDVKAEFGEDAKSRSFSHALVDLLSEKRKPVPEELLTEQDDSVTITRAEVQTALEEYKKQHSVEDDQH